MGKPTGFLEYTRSENAGCSPLERIKNFNEFHTPLSEEERRKQGARCMNCGVPFCQSGVNIGGMFTGCPLHNLIPEWNDGVYHGYYGQALERLLKTNSFPEFTGRVCPALCEAACCCGLNGSPVTVRDNELAIIEKGFADGEMTAHPPKTRTQKRVAVIGSGPSGLAVADMLNKRGHNVTVYERDDRVGGLLMYGIPNMKLDKRVIERRIALMQAEGVAFICNADVGGNCSAEEIMDKFDAVVLCVGAKNARDIKVDGRSADGVYFAVDYLKAATSSLLGETSEKTDKVPETRINAAKGVSAKGKNVIVLGGGDTGNDCVGTAVRQGASSVIQLEMMPKPPETRAANNPWPQWPRVLKTDYGQQEAAAVFGNDPRLFQTTVKSLTADENGRLKQVTTVGLVPSVNASGRTVMAEKVGSEQTMDAQLLLIAAGFLGAESYVSQAFGVETTERTNIASVNGKYGTSVPKVFTAGDAHRGQSLVVWAITEGRDCAREVDNFLMGYSNI